MNTRTIQLVLIGLALAATVISASLLLREAEEVPPVEPAPVAALPDFTDYQDVKHKKREFFKFLLPMIRSANEKEAERRQFIADLDANNLTRSDIARLHKMAQRYRIKHEEMSGEELLARLRTKVDVVPASLVLAQAANESGWGTSRFARQGNNLFGIWCFTEGCGLAPRQRSEGARHEVEKFPSVQAAVDKYIRTINSHPAYADLREVRKNLREKEKPLRGTVLATGLVRYSERGEEYINEIQSMIEYNSLEDFNKFYR